MARNQAPTLKQIRTLQNMNQGMTVHRAMKEAGYSQTSLKQSYKFKKSPIVRNMMLGLSSKLKDKGFDTDFLADKFMEWMTAQKPFSSHTEPDKEVPDYDIQIKAYDRVKEIINPQSEAKGVKRKLTIEEFVTGEEGGDSNAR